MHVFHVRALISCFQMIDLIYCMRALIKRTSVPILLLSDHPIMSVFPVFTPLPLCLVKEACRHQERCLFDSCVITWQMCKKKHMYNTPSALHVTTETHFFSAFLTQQMLRWAKSGMGWNVGANSWDTGRF